MNEQNKKVPTVRFKGFTNDWEQHKLEEMAEIVRGASPRPIKDKKWFDSNSTIGWIRISDVTAQNGRIYHLSQHISKLGQQKTRVVIQPHLLLSIAASVGYPVINYIPTGVHDGFLIFNNPKFNINYMFYWLRKYQTNWKKYGQPGSQVNLNSSIVSNTKVRLPSLDEQATISNIFYQIDKILSLQQRKLDLLKQLKKGLLQKMFADKDSKRPVLQFKIFHDDWEQRKLGDLIKEFSIKSKIEDEYKVLSSTNSGMKFREGRVTGTSNLGYKIIKNGDLVLSPQNLWLGNININNIGKGLVSPSYKTFKLINIDSSFINPQLRTQKMLEEYKNSSTQGASVVRRNLEIDSFYQIKIFVPTISEQEKIGSFFQRLDNTIVLQHQKLAKCQSVKKSLLQQMFI